jgi:hypothetical protein
VAVAPVRLELRDEVRLPAQGQALGQRAAVASGRMAAARPASAEPLELGEAVAAMAAPGPALPVVELPPAEEVCEPAAALQRAEAAGARLARGDA